MFAANLKTAQPYVTPTGQNIPPRVVLPAGAVFTVLNYARVRLMLPIHWAPGEPASESRLALRSCRVNPRQERALPSSRARRVMNDHHQSASRRQWGTCQ